MKYLKYLGVPYKYRGYDMKGLDCITLCQKLGADYGVNIGNINYVNIPLENVFSVFAVNMINTSKYVETIAKAHVLVVFKIQGKVQHVGYMVSENKFVHILEGRNVALESLESPSWNKRIVGFYEYVGK